MHAHRWLGAWQGAVTLTFLVVWPRAMAQPDEPQVYQPPPVPPADGVWKFDFGGAEGPAEPGYYRVAPDTEYSPARRFGYTEGRARPQPFDQNRRIIRDVLVLDDVTRDGIYWGNPFRVDLPDGRYHVVVLTGEYSRPGPNRPDSHFREYSIGANGVVLYEQENAPEVFFAPDGRYFHNYYRDWHPNVNLYAENIARWIPFGEADVAATAGRLEVQASQYAPINALWVFPAGSAQGEAALEAFRAKQQATFNDQYAYLPGEPELPVPDTDESDVLIYVHDSAQTLRPETRPVPSDLGRPLRLFASRGEREAGVIAVTPLRDLGGTLDLTVSDLRGPEGAALPASAFDVRYIRYGEYPVVGGYEVRPHFLVPWRPDRVEEGITRGFWVDLHTPEDAQPGFYDGTLRVSGAGINASLPVEVRVLPLELPMCRLYAGVYAGGLYSTTFRHYRMQGDPPRELITQVLRTRMQFYADQGFTGLFDSLPWWPLEFQDGEVVPTEEWDRYLDVFRIAKSIPNFRERIFCYYLGGPQLFPKCPHYLSVQQATKLDIDEIRFTDEAVEEMAAMAKFLYREMRREELPELVFYVFDELGNHGAKGARWGREMLKAISRCREAVPGGFRTCVSTLRASIAREYLSEADIVMPNSAYPLTAETIAEIRRAGCTLGLYNLGATRFSYGFYPWRVDAYLRAQWSFSYDGDSRDPFVALPAGARVSCDCHFTPDWEVLPSIGMLNQREGVDDYRYIQLLEEVLAAAQDAGRAASPATKQGKQVIADLREAISETYLDPDNHWDDSTMDYWRWQVAKAAMALAAEGAG
ncbi:MAG: hypothetical protein ACE5R4_08390 [Armatimonadota bacterium]